MNADGRHARQLTRPGPVGSPTWSPDGRRLAFTDDFGISVVNADGTGERSFLLEPPLPGSIDWSPNGKEILATKLGVDVVAVRVDGTRSRTVAEGSAGGAVWSPDGRRIAFSKSNLRRGTIDLSNSIYLVNADGSNLRRLTRGGYDDFDPSWSPDGQQLVFERYPPGTFTTLAGQKLVELYTVRTDGRGLRRLTRNVVYDSSPTWRPRGTAAPPPPPPPPVERKQVKIPEVRRLKLPAALERLRAAHLHGRFVEEHRDPYADYLVVSQAPSAGTKVARGTVVQLTGFDVSDPFAGRKFDRRVWLAHPTCEGDANPRARMYRDLAHNHLKPGMKREAVVRLLGRPGHGEDWPLGAASGFKLDCDYLHVDYDDGGLERVSHWQS